MSNVIKLFADRVGTALDDMPTEAAAVVGDGHPLDGNCDLDIIRNLVESEAALYVVRRLTYTLQRLVDHPHSDSARRDARLALHVAGEFDAMRSTRDAS